MLLAPIYALAGYQGAVWALILMGALAAALAWRWTVATLNAPGAATFAWAAIALSAPFMFNTFTIYPEIAAALAVMFALTTTLRANTDRSGPAAVDRRRHRDRVAAVAEHEIRADVGRPAPGRHFPSRFSVETGTCFTFTRTESLGDRGDLCDLARRLVRIFLRDLGKTAADGAVRIDGADHAAQSAIRRTRAAVRSGIRAAGLRAGLHPRRDRPVSDVARAAGSCAGRPSRSPSSSCALLATVGAFGIWWGGTSAPARPIASGLLLLMLPIATAFRSAPAGSPRRAAQHLLLWIGVGIAITLAIGQDGLLINNARDGTSALLDFWSPRWELWSLAPTFIADRWILAWLNTAWWLIVATAAAAVAEPDAQHPRRASRRCLRSRRLRSRCGSSRSPSRCCRPRGRNRRSISARARVSPRSTDSIHGRGPRRSSTTRCSKGAATDALPQLILGVKPGSAPIQQPVRVIHNGRFSLPAGTYTISVQFNEHASAAPLPLSLQIGRNGPPLQTWMVQPQAGQQFQAPLWLPVDASFVGLRGPVELERAVAAITITPVAVVDAGARPLVPIVLAAAVYPGATLFFHDEQLYPEPNGFWTLGGNASHVTVAVRPGHTAPVVLRMHPGAVENNVIVSTFGWQRSFTMVPGAGGRGRAADVRQRRGPVDDRRRLGVLSAGRRSQLDRSPLPRHLGRSHKQDDTNTMTTLADLRREYASRALTEDAADADPTPAVRRVVRRSAEVAVDRRQRDDARDRIARRRARGAHRAAEGRRRIGFVFYTNYESAKGRDLAANPRACLLFFWAELERQVRITGAVTQDDERRIGELLPLAAVREPDRRGDLGSKPDGERSFAARETLR